MNAKLKSSGKCHHQDQSIPNGLALICLGQTKIRPSGDKCQRPSESISDIPARLCDSLPESALQGVCRFDLTLQSDQLMDYLLGHQAAIIFDTSDTGALESTVCILDLGAMLDRTLPINLGSRNGFALAEQLRGAKRHSTLPERVIFFGFEVASLVEADSQSRTVKPLLSQPMTNISGLVAKMVETLKHSLAASRSSY